MVATAVIGMAVGVTAVMVARTAGSDPAPEPPRVEQVAAEQAYLEQVEAVQEIRDEEIDELRDMLDRAYQTRQRLWQVAADSQLRAATDEAIAAAARLDPPTGYRPAHDRWVTALQRSRRHLEDSHDARERHDLVGMVVAFMRSELALAGQLPEWPEQFCRAAIPKSHPVDANSDVGGGPDVACRRGASIPGGAYGEQLYRVVLRTEIEVGHRIGLSDLPAFTAEERMAYLRVIQPEVEARLDEALQAVRVLDPPPHLAADHARVIGFYEDILSVARCITLAAAEGDDRRVLALARESLRPGNALRQQLSADSCAILDGFGFFSGSRGC